MPVNELLCEGVEGGPDVRLLRAILRRSVGEVRPSGGKDGFRNLVVNLRASSKTSSVCGLADGDFPRKPGEWTPAPPCREWHVSTQKGQTMIGWMWRRKEIENYLVDPEVVGRALRWDTPKKEAYAAGLERVFDALAYATAARIALTEHAPTRTRMETAMRIDAGDAAAEQALRDGADDYNRGARIDVEALIESYRKWRVECLPGGKFRACAIDVFAGKNILAKIQQTAGFPPEVKDAVGLFERILDALEKDPAPHTWVPEWTALRAAVEAWVPPS